MEYIYIYIYINGKLNTKENTIRIQTQDSFLPPAGKQKDTYSQNHKINTCDLKPCLQITISVNNNRTGTVVKYILKYLKARIMDLQNIQMKRKWRIILNMFSPTH